MEIKKGKLAVRDVARRVKRERKEGVIAKTRRH